MARRAPYTEVQKVGQIRPDRVINQGDVLYRRFECLSPNCNHVLVVQESDCGSGFSIKCPECGFLHFSGGTLELFNYTLIEKKSGKPLKDGPFSASHDVYLDSAEGVKYCLNCYTMQPLTNFHHHRTRVNTGRQGECQMCKRVYNDLKNDSRLSEQHREAQETRRLLTALSGESNIGNISELLERFEYACFNCGRALDTQPGGEGGYYLDHTLPVSWLWPLDHGPTVLCRGCNGEKRDRWPSEFYEEDDELRVLSTRTGIPYELLSSRPFFNPDALARLRSDPNPVIERWVKHPGKLKVLKARVEGETGEDIFANASPQARRAVGI
jgi:hypothetical protein